MASKIYSGQIDFARRVANRCENLPLPIASMSLMSLSSSTDFGSASHDAALLAATSDGASSESVLHMLLCQPE